MGREPNWWTKGFTAAKKGSKMSLPEDYFNDVSIIENATSKDFNPFKESFEYALNWLETQQWKEEVGNKILKFIKKVPSENLKITEFKNRAMKWVDGYSYYMVEHYFLLWLAIPHELDDRQTNVIIEQALDEVQI